MRLFDSIKRETHMNDTYIVVAYSVLEDLLTAYGYQFDVRSRVRAAEVLIVAVVAAKFFQNHHEHALSISKKVRGILHHF